MWDTDGFNLNVHLPPAPANFQRGVTRRQYSMQGDVSTSLLVGIPNLHCFYKLQKKKSVRTDRCASFYTLLPPLLSMQNTDPTLKSVAATTQE